VTRVIRPASAYRLPITVRFSECDPLGHANNAAYLTWLEQAAIDHAILLGWPQDKLDREAGGVFVARRHEIDYLRAAYQGDHLEVLTWPDSMHMATALRRYVIRRAEVPYGAPEIIDDPDLASFETGEVLVRAVTRWAFVQRDPVRPIRIPAHVLNDFLTIESGEDDR
jgi:acyl-CoA thioester hydrolase